MTGSPPDFDALVGDVLDPEERARLHRVHELLLEAGPPPELAPDLRTPQAQAGPTARVISFPRRRRGAAMLVAAAFAIAVFGAGWLGGAHGRSAHVERTIAMSGPGGARASLAVLHADRAGNWPMVLKISGLAPLPSARTYALWLTKRGKLEASCGSFTVGLGTTTVRLNAPFHLKEYSGWVVVAPGSASPLLRTASI